MNDPFWRVFRNEGKSQEIVKPEVLRILVAEDNVLQQSLVSLLLKRLGHTVTVVDDGFEAVTSVQVHDFDVILMDCQMPLMNGMEATRFIREIYARSKRKQEVIIIGISATSTPEACFDAGMDFFLRKPLKLPILGAVLGRLKRKNHQTRQTLESNLSATCCSERV